MKIYLIIDHEDVINRYDSLEEAVVKFSEYYSVCRDDYGYDEEDLTEVNLVSAKILI